MPKPTSVRAFFNSLMSDARAAYSAMTAYQNGVDQLKDLAPSMTLAEHVLIAKSLRHMREQAEALKASLTTATIKVDEMFAMRIAEDTGDVAYEVDGIRYSATAKCFASAPSQRKSPVEFAEFKQWMEENGHGPLIDIDDKGVYRITGLSKLCESLLEDSQPLPPHVKCHMVDAVRIRKLDEDPLKVDDSDEDETES